MNLKVSVRTLGVLCIVFLVLSYQLVAQQSSMGSGDVSNGHLYFIEPGPVEQSTLYADGSVIELQTESVTQPMINSDMTDVTLEEFKRMVQSGLEAFENDPNKIVIGDDDPSRGLDIIFNISSPPPGAVAALAAAESYIESVFDDDITVTIGVNFASLPPGVLGWTMVNYAGTVTWTNTRNGLVSGMDGDDTVQVWLPSGATIPVRYFHGSPVVWDEGQCFFAKANYRATIGSVSGDAASMEFNTDFTWDYDPSNGVSGFCFQSVVVHEVGHALGFTSAADFRYQDIEAMDIFRFQRSDDVGDYNPDTYAEFQTTARMVDKDDQSSSSDDVNSDLIFIEHRMSDGTPYQCSHFSQGNVNALMQPAVSSGTTFYPNFYRWPDIDVFDAIGWDFSLTGLYTLTVAVDGSGYVEKAPDLPLYSPERPVKLTAYPELGWSFDHWSGSLTGNNNPDTLVMDGNKSVTAHITQDQYELIIHIVGNGIVNRVPDQPFYTYGTEVELTAVPDSGWEFNAWLNELTGNQNPDTILMDKDKNVVCTFVQTGVYDSTGNFKEPEDFKIFHISSNPVGKKSVIEYHLPVGQDVILHVYNVKGQVIEELVSGYKQAGTHQVIWDGLDKQGQEVCSGVYFYHIKTSEGYKDTKKLLLLR